MITLNGRLCFAAKLFVPWQGRWVVDVCVEGVLPSGTVTLQWGAATYVGTVHESSVQRIGYCDVRVVGGIGWSRLLKTVGGWLHNDAGLPCSSIAQALAKAVGETLVSDMTAFRQGRVSHARAARRASQELEALLGAGQAWWVEPAGITRAGARPDVALVSAVELLDYDDWTRFYAPDPSFLPLGGIMAASDRSPRFRVIELEAIADGGEERYNVSTEVVA